MLRPPVQPSALALVRYGVGSAAETVPVTGTIASGEIARAFTCAETVPICVPGTLPSSAP